MSTNTNDLDLSALKKYVELWDAWHLNWRSNKYESEIKMESLSPNEKENQKIELPYFEGRIKKGTPKELSFGDIFPEPYWGHIDITKPLKGIFLNINPKLDIAENDFIEVEGNPIHNKHCDNIKTSMDDQKYSDYIKQDNLQDHIKETNKWFNEKRCAWYRCLLEDKEIDRKGDTQTAAKTGKKEGNCQKNDSISVPQLLFAEVLPWATPQKNKLATYLKNECVQKFIVSHLNGIAWMANNCIDKNSPLKNKVIVRSSAMLDLIDENVSFRKLFNHEGFYAVFYGETSKFKKYVTNLNVLKHNETGVYFFVFSGGQSMTLPDVNLLAFKLSPDNNNKTDQRLCDLIRKYGDEEIHLSVS